ncbi:hypothetical protein A9K97_gp456 [Tokyovirus A1]|uniref:hypothetical protein n=1 Tax=Tokyovirus A1 TaxID=1826170 RepID=UPI0007A97E34|nr:hypothetical protein A9K97_gp456 [Tokyovirus A1]BAU79895.1 hypothetical protein [Tokyovirus A1]
MSTVEILSNVDLETTYNGDEEFQANKGLLWEDYISLELMCVQQQIQDVKRELQELLDMETDLEFACVF